MRGRRDGLTGRGRRAVAALVAFGAFPVSDAEAQAPPQEATSAIIGQAIDFETGVALQGVTVSLIPVGDTLDRGQAARTDRAGTFYFGPIAPGRYQLGAGLAGYSAIQDTVEVEAGRQMEVVFPLQAAPVELDPMLVEVGQRPVGPLVDFERRRQSHAGLFMDREQIEASNAIAFTDLVRRVPGARLVPTASFGHRVLFRGGCSPDLWLDGIQVPMSGNVDSFLRPQDMEAMEVYRGTDLPGEFGTNLCGAIVAWTKRGDPTPEKRSLKRQFLVAGSILAAFVLIHR